MRRFPKIILFALYATIAVITIKILANVESSNFHDVYMVLPAYVGLCIGTRCVRKHMNAREIEEILGLAYERAQLRNITYADEEDILRECLTKKEAQRLRTLRGEYPHEAY